MGGKYLSHPDASRSFQFELGDKGNLTADFPSLGALFDLSAPGHYLMHEAVTETGNGYLAAERVNFDPGNPARFIVLAYHIPGATAARQIATVPASHMAGGFAAILLASLIALLILRRVFAPLVRLVETAEKIADGSRDVQLPHGGSGEVASLVQAFDTMLTGLKRREQEILLINETLEERVKERTIWLEQARRESERLLQRNEALLRTSIDGIHIMDVEGKLLEANDAFYRMLGYTREDAAHLNVSDWNAQFTRKELCEQFRDIVGKNALYETAYRHKDGALIDVEIGISGVEIDGRPLVFASARDITERKMTEESLRIAAAAFETRDAIAVTDVMGQIVRVNHAFTDITGYTWHA